jgi:DNA-binding beta-propeller fold protein YncE
MVGTADGRWAFTSLTDAAGVAGIGVVALGNGSLRLVRTVTLPSQLIRANGMALTHDGRFLLVAGTTATAVLGVAALEDGSPDSVVGVLPETGTGQFEVAVTDDDRYAFVTDETSGDLTVYNLATALQSGFSAPGVVADFVPLAVGATGIAIAPNRQRIYVSTFGPAGPHGQLWVLDSARVESGAGSAAILGHVAAGCEPLRVAVAPSGNTVWVTALQSDALLGFSAPDLTADPAQALRAVVPVGSEPVGLILIDGGQLALADNSNRGLVPGTGSDTPQTVSVVSTAAALARRPSVLGAVQAGLFPRDLSFDQATGEVLVANYDSDTVEEFPAPPLR